jgi:hypothetical protein
LLKGRDGGCGRWWPLDQLVMLGLAWWGEGMPALACGGHMAEEAGRL